jgi:hypothetical protein
MFYINGEELRGDIGEYERAIARRMVEEGEQGGMMHS